MLYIYIIILLKLKDMKKLILTIGTFLISVSFIFAQTGTVQGNVQLSNLTDFSGINVHISGTTFNSSGDVVNITGDVVTDINGNYNFTCNLYTNPLYPFAGNQYLDAVLDFTFSKVGYDSETVDGIGVNTTPITVDNSLLFPTGVSIYQPQICMVRYDTLTNIPNVVWERELGNNVKSYIIFKLINQKWETIDTLDFNDLSVFEDLQADPTTAYQYQIQAIFNDNSRSRYSSAKNAPEISITTQDGVPKITWVNINELSRIDPLVIHKVILFRSNTDHNWKQIDSVDITTATQDELIARATMYDTNIPEDGIYYYRIGHRYISPCAPANPLVKTESGPFILAMSNIAESENALTSISALENSPIEISVIDNSLSISSKIKGTYTVSTIDGKVVENGAISNQKIVLDKGVYVVQCITAGTLQSKKIIIE
jgi:hypothetical protein